MSEVITRDNIPEPLQYLPEEFLADNIAVLDSDPTRLIVTIMEAPITGNTPAFRGHFVSPDKNPVSYGVMMGVPVDNPELDIKRAVAIIGLVNLLHQRKLPIEQVAQTVMNIVSVLEPGTHMLHYNWFHIQMHSDDSFKVYGYHLVPKRPSSLN